MADEESDDVDKAILYALQEDARNMSSGAITERTAPLTVPSVSVSCVSNPMA